MNPIPDFLVTYDEVLQRIDKINPVQYARSRNFLDGAVSYLSPFITHGIIATKTVADIVLVKHNPRDSEKLMSELGWREFFHRVWQAKNEAIFDDLRSPQARITTGKIPQTIIQANTQITALDQSLQTLLETGYMHNHARMWTASVVGNVAQTHWYQPAKWMHYHLLDGDLASNSLSWQWIVGAFSHKKYYANQENLNKYSKTQQRNTFLDIPYEAFDQLEIPSVLDKRVDLNLQNAFPISTYTPVSPENTPFFLYSIWNLDPQWRAGDAGTRVLWIDPAMHQEFPLSPKRWQFISHWAGQIPGLSIFVGSQSELFPDGTAEIELITREYPATKHWPGTRDERLWCYPNATGYFKNFFSYWKQAQK